jgi:hypothetical protein
MIRLEPGYRATIAGTPAMALAPHDAWPLQMLFSQIGL